jgi:hypothetical protein
VFAVSCKVLDVGQVVAGNFCGAILAYFGADVIKASTHAFPIPAPCPYHLHVQQLHPASVDLTSPDCTEGPAAGGAAWERGCPAILAHDR